MNYKTLYNEDKIFLSTYNSWNITLDRKKLSNINFKKDRVIYSNGKFPTEIFKNIIMVMKSIFTIYSKNIF